MLALALYLITGLIFGVAFVTSLAGRLDANAREGSWGFRLLILPGAIALWPLVLWLTLRRNA
jgi:hypothetical protein